MDELYFSFQDSLIPKREIEEKQADIEKELKAMKEASFTGYEDDRASINLPFDENIKKDVERVVEIKKKLDPEYLVVVGMGGSILGARAVQEAIWGRLFNQLKPKTKILYADNADPYLIMDIKRILEPVLESEANVLLNVVSKSGTTTESLANMQLLIDLLKGYKKDHSRYLVVTTEKDSPLWNLAVKEDYSLLEIPRKIGGRYSVFSPSALFPLGLLDVNLSELLSGARQMRDRCLNPIVEDNPAAYGALVTYLHHRKGNSIYNLFFYAHDLLSLGAWHRQLMAESLGKEHNNQGEKVFEGLTPISCIGSSDLHSMGQLLLGGPIDKLVSFVKVEGKDSMLTIPVNPDYAGLVKGLQGKPLGTVLDAIYEGVKSSFRAKNRAFTEVVLPGKREASIGQYLQYKMMETMILGSLLEVNPFNQPNVESYKSETRQILGD